MWLDLSALSYRYTAGERWNAGERWIHYYQHANAIDAQSQLVRRALAQHELLSNERLQQQADGIESHEGTPHEESR